MFKKNNYDQKRFPGNMMPFGNIPPQAGMNPFAQPTMPGMNQPNMYPGPQSGGMFPGLQFDRLQFEIMENRRRINNLAKRVARIESYLRIKDVPEYGYVDDEKPSNFSF